MDIVLGRTDAIEALADTSIAWFLHAAKKDWDPEPAAI